MFTQTHTGIQTRCLQHIHTAITITHNHEFDSIDSTQVEERRAEQSKVYYNQ